MAKECGSTTCDKSSCEGCSKKNNPQSMLVAANEQSDIRHVIGIISGKGGVGKSFVTGSLANMMAEAGFKVGILDADITGPSIARMYGIRGEAQGTEKAILPFETRNHIKVMSVNFLLPSEETPVIWRGPILAGMVKQFWSDVVWGDLDYLFVDMPPGTGDVPLTVFQSIPLDGVFIVTTPQDLVKMIVTKAYNMAEMMHVPVLGLFENFSYMVCPGCQEKIYPFGESRLSETAADLRLPVAGQMPIDPEIAKKADLGLFHEVKSGALEAAKAVLPV